MLTDVGITRGPNIDKVYIDETLDKKLSDFS